MIFGPACAFQAEDVPKLYVTAAYHVPDPVPGALVGQLFWATNLDGDIALGEYSEEQSIEFDVVADDQYHTYTLDLSSCPAYEGLITNLRLDPIFVGSNGNWVDILAISHRPDATAYAPECGVSLRPAI